MFTNIFLFSSTRNNKIYTKEICEKVLLEMETFFVALRESHGAASQIGTSDCYQWQFLFYFFFLFHLEMLILIPLQDGNCLLLIDSLYFNPSDTFDDDLHICSICEVLHCIYICCQGLFGQRVCRESVICLGKRNALHNLYWTV